MSSIKKETLIKAQITIESRLISLKEKIDAIVEMADNTNIVVKKIEDLILEFMSYLKLSLKLQDVLLYYYA